MADIKITAEPLTCEAFAPFGQVISTEGRTPISINAGNTERFDSLATVQCALATDHTVINIFRAQPRSLPMRIQLLERHPLGSQSFQPLSQEPYLVLVADPVDQPAPENLRLFLAGPQQGINYAMNTWHHPVLGLNRVCNFLVVDRKGSGDNCEEFYFDDNLNILITL